MSRKSDALSAPWQACGCRGGRVRAAGDAAVRDPRGAETNTDWHRHCAYSKTPFYAVRAEVQIIPAFV